MMTDRITDWVIIVIYLGILWVLGYRGHFNIATSPRVVTNLPKWMRLVSGHPREAIFDLHGLAMQVVAVLLCLVQTIAVFMPGYTNYRYIVLWITMLGSLIIGVILVIVLYLFYRAKP